MFFCGWHLILKVYTVLNFNLNNLAQFYIIVADKMIKNDHLILIKRNLIDHGNHNDILQVLSYLIERSPVKSLENGFYEYLFPQLLIKNEFQKIILKCFSLLIQAPKAQKKCDESDVIQKLYVLLKDDELDYEIHTNVSMVVKNCTYSTRSIWRASQFWDLTIVLIKRANCKKCPDLQIYCLQALRKISEMPFIKNFLRKCCKKNLKNLFCLSEMAKILKSKLLFWLRYKGYRFEQTTGKPIKNKSLIGNRRKIFAYNIIRK